MSCMMEKNIKDLSLQKGNKQLNSLAFSLFHYPPSFLESFCISQPKLKSMIVLKDSSKLFKFTPYKLGTFS